MKVDRAQKMAAVTSFDKTKVAYEMLGGEFSQESLNGLMMVAGCSGGALMASEVGAQTAAVIVNQRGSGQSDGSKDLADYSVPAFARDLVAISEDLGTKRVAIVGASHGAAAAFEFARSFPERVAALVLVEPALFVDKRMLRERVELVLAGKTEQAVHYMLSYAAPHLHGRELKEMTDSILMNYKNPMGLAGDWYARALYNVSEAHLSDISVPTLVVGGTRSNIRADVARIAAAIPNATLWWMRGATHLVTYEWPASLVRTIKFFIDESMSNTQKN